MKYFLAAFLIGIAPYVNGSVAESSGVCGYDCLTVERIGQDYYIVARSSVGEIVKLHPVPDSLALSESAAAQLSMQLADPNSSGALLSWPAQAWPAQDSDSVVAPTSSGSTSGDGTTETFVSQFETPTEIVIVMITVYRDEDDNIIHVDVHTIRIPKDTSSELPDD